MKEMTNNELKILEFEKISSRLEELSPATLENLTELALKYIKEIPTMKSFSTGEVATSDSLFPAENPVAASEIASTLRQVFSDLVRSGVNTGSGGFLGYIPGGGIPMAAVGDFIAALLNRYSGFYQVSPGNTHLENEVIKWLVREFDFGPSAWGTLTSGGTIATLSSLVVVRDQKDITDFSKLTIYMTSQTHSAASRSLKVAGLARAQVRLIPTGPSYKMDTDFLEKQISEDISKRLVPLVVIGNAGTTNTGAVDPRRKISHICKKFKVWFHVDGAYGGFFQLTNEGKKILDGIGEADSLVLDPHKSLFMPYGCGAVLFKDGELARKSFTDQAVYLREAHQSEEKSPANYSIELTRHSRGPRVWLPLKIFGRDTFSSALEEKLLLAQYLAVELQKMNGIELACLPELSCVVFRYKDSPHTKKLLENINDSGQVYLTSTQLGENFYIRACILSFRTHKKNIEDLISEIKRFTVNF